MSNFNRRDFLLHLAPLATASTILLSGEEAFAQMKPFRLQTPRQNQSFAVGEQIQIAALLKTQSPRLLRMDFRANGALIGSGTWRSPRITWTPTLAGNHTITAEAISLQGSIISTATTNVSILTVLYDKLGIAGNWGFNASSLGLLLFYEQLDEDNQFYVGTIFIGSFPTPTILKKLEFAVNYYSNVTGQDLPLASITGGKIKIWDTTINNFFANATMPSLSVTSPGAFNIGNTNSPVSNGIFVVGSDNLNILLPANRVLEISVQCPVNTSAEHFFVSRQSFISPQTTRFANRVVGGSQQNGEDTNFTSSVKLWGMNA